MYTYELPAWFKNDAAEGWVREREREEMELRISAKKKDYWKKNSRGEGVCFKKDEKLENVKESVRGRKREREGGKKKNFDCFFFAMNYKRGRRENKKTEFDWSNF